MVFSRGLGCEHAISSVAHQEVIIQPNQIFLFVWIAWVSVGSQRPSGRAARQSVPPQLKRGSTVPSLLLEPCSLLPGRGERWAKARGMVELASDAEIWNKAGIAAHKAVGFRETFRDVLFLKKLRR